jgi:hypothetical protein
MGADFTVKPASDLRRRVDEATFGEGRASKLKLLIGQGRMLKHHIYRGRGLRCSRFLIRLEGLT